MFANVTVGESGAVTAGKTAFGLAKLGILNKLNDCAVKSSLTRSVRLNVLDSPTSRCRKCGPKYCMNPSLPSVPFACDAYAPGLKNASLEGVDRFGLAMTSTRSLVPSVVLLTLAGLRIVNGTLVDQIPRTFVCQPLIRAASHPLVCWPKGSA